MLANLRALAEAAKVALSERERVTLRVPLAGGVEAQLTRQGFEGLCKQLFRRARLPLDRACWQVCGGEGGGGEAGRARRPARRCCTGT